MRDVLSATVPHGVFGKDRVEAWLRVELSRRLGLDVAQIDVRKRFNEYGLDSSGATTLLAALSEWLRRPLPPTLVWDCPTLESLAAFVACERPPTSLLPVHAVPSVAKAMHDEPIAIVGMACRFPLAPNLEEFWKLLSDGRDAISEIPPDRWDIDATYSSAESAPGKMGTRWGGFLDRIDTFDPMFFSISPREAMAMDPQQRLMLELSWEALEHAGIVPPSLKGSKTGVYFGVSWNDYAMLNARAGLDSVSAYSATGAHYSIVANRVSYFLGLQGPSLAIDTASSSSLVAVHIACQALRNGEAAIALAGGVNLIAAPDGMVAMSKLGTMAQDGRCKAFDARANGYVRGEGGAVVVLKPLSRALADGDAVACVILGSAVNNDGFSNGLTAPNPKAQEDMLRDAYSRAGRDPTRVDYVEAHGTGTVLGDPIEAKALGAVLGAGRRAGRPLRVGSVKTNIGHLEAAAGVAGLVKVALAIGHRSIPPNLHFKTPNPHIPFHDLNIAIPTSVEPWPGDDEPRLCGISSFGFGGTNCHVVVESLQADRTAAVPVDLPPSVSHDTEGAASGPAAALGASERLTEPALLPISAHSTAALAERVKAIQDWIECHPALEWPDLCYTASRHRAHLTHRLSISASSSQAALMALRKIVEGGFDALASSELSAFTGAPRVVFVFPGQGGQWPGMGRQLFESEPRFRHALVACDRALRAHTGWSLIERMQAGEPASHVNDVDIIQPMIFALQVALATLWQSWGIAPSAVIGHSMGEIAAAHVAGVLSLESASLLVARRSRIIREHASGRGGMAMVELSLQEASHAIAGWKELLSVGASNGPRACILSGDRGALEQAVERLRRRDVFCAHVNVDYASHSAQMDPLKPLLLQALSGISPGRNLVPFYSPVTRGWIRGEQLDAAYWINNLREPVHFASAIRCLREAEMNLFLEVSSHPVLVQSIAETLRDRDQDGDAIPSLRRNDNERESLLLALGKLYTRGCMPDWTALYPRGGRRVSLPNYPFQRTRYWLPDTTSVQERNSTGHPRHVAERAEQDVKDWLYSIAWREQRGSEGTAIAVSGTWLIWMDQGGVGWSVAEALRGRGARCVLVRSGVELREDGDDIYTLDPARTDQVRRLLGQAHEGAHVRGVIHLMGLDGAAEAEATAEGVESAIEQGCISALCLVQALAMDTEGGSPRLWLVTRRGQGVCRGEEVQASQAALWGLGRTIATEHPELGCTRVDLGGSDPKESAQALLGALLEEADEKEDEMALRPGKRLVPRLARHPAEPSSDARTPSMEATPGRDAFQLNIAKPGNLDTLWLGSCMRALPGPGRVQIAVRAAGLNFRDVLKALGEYPGAAGGAIPLGDECAGVVTAVGEGVNGLRVGDEVLALLAEHAFASFVTVPASQVMLKPRGMSFEDAATIPSVFLTAWYALHEQAKLGSGERVLIHAAAGGVGLAAVQIAQQLGATIYATAGSEGKREYLRSQGVEHVYDSRSLEFVQAVREATGGQGVDVVLNSLAGEFLPASLSLLRPFGRFVELGKKDVYGNTRLGLEPFKRNLSFTMVDVDLVGRERPELLSKMLREVMQWFEEGRLSPICRQTFPMSRAEEAFRWMAQAKHIGKIALVLGEEKVPVCPASAADGVGFRPDGTYLITGGLGGLGLCVARWMAEHGAQHVVLMGRREPGESARQVLDALADMGVKAVAMAGDVSVREDVDRVLAHIDGKMPPLRGIVHAAGVLEDATLQQMDRARFMEPLAPKVKGAWNLHRASCGRPLDHFVLFSSVASVLGPSGQGNYAAANAFLDGLAWQRRAAGLPGLSINWGSFSEVGLAAAQTNRGERLAAMGLSPLRPAEGLDALGRVLRQPDPQVIVARIDLPQWRASVTAGPSSLLSGIGASEGSSPSQDGAIGMRTQIMEADRTSRETLLTAHLKSLLAKVLQLPAEQIRKDIPFRSMGMDSLTGLEFRNRLEATLTIRLSTAVVWSHPTISKLVPHIAERLGVPLTGVQPSEGAKAPLKSAGETVLEGLSEKELAAHLDEKLAQLDGSKVRKS